MMRPTTPPSAPASERSSPAYHSSPGESVETLSDSWIPIADPNPEPASPSHSSDNDTLSTIGSEHDDDTAGYLTDSSEGHEHDHARVDDLLDGEDYTDAESPATDLRGSSSTLGREEKSLHSSLIYPYADTGDSFTTTTSDSTTPNASVGALPAVPRMSAYRLEKLARDRQEVESRVQTGSRGSLWSPSPEIQHMINGAEPEHMFIEPTGDQGRETMVENAKPEDLIPTAQEIREGVRNDRLRRTLTSAKAAGIKAGGQKWSLRMSLFTLASLLGVVLATARYNTSASAKSAAAPEPVPAPAPTSRSFSLFDFLTVPALSASVLDSSPSSIMPDVRLIKNALSLSTKAIPLAPAEIENTVRSPLPKSVAAGKTKSASIGSISNALSARTTEAGLSTFFDSKTAWQKTLREFVRPSARTVPPVNATLGECECDCGYGQMILADFKAWTRSLSRFSHANLINFIRDHVVETIKQELREAIALAAQILELSKNATQAAGLYMRKTADQTQHRAQNLYENIRSYGTSINMTASTQKAYDAAHAARSGLDVVSSQAAMTSQKGREAIHKARAGLDYLVAEAKRIKGDGSKIKPAVPPPRRRGKGGFGVRERFRAHRLKGRRASDNTKKPDSATTKPKVKGSHLNEDNSKSGSTFKQKLMSALHNAAMPFVI